MSARHPPKDAAAPPAGKPGVRGDVRMRGFKQRTEVRRFLDLVRERTAALPVEAVPLAEAAGRILAEPVQSTVDVPAFDRSAMDGYALRSEETFGAGPYNPLTFQVVGEVTPGRAFEGTVGPGQAVRIMTGAPIPAGADAVLMAEDAEERGSQMTASGSVAPRKNVGRRGEDIRAGQDLLAPGRRLRPQDLGVLASIGHGAERGGQVQAYRRPSVSLLITGNELLRPGEKPTGAMIVDSNSVMLRALIERDGGTLAELLHVPDERETLRTAMREAKGDLVVTTGGTSVGVEDHAPTLLEEEGELLVHGVAMRPSAPTGFGVLGQKPVFLLPGNPVSCLAAYDVFVALALRRLAGASEAWPYCPQRVTLKERISSAIGRVDYCRIRLEGPPEAPLAVPLATSGASILSTTVLADGFLLVDQDSEGYAAGEPVEVWRYG